MLIIALDLLVGLWIKLHYPAALPWFFLLNTPTIGLGAFIWGLLPKPQQEAVSQMPSGCRRCSTGTGRRLTEGHYDYLDSRAA